MFHLFLLIQLIAFVQELASQSAKQILTQNPMQYLRIIQSHMLNHILPVSVKPAIPMSVSNFCVSSTLSNSSDAMVQKHSFDSHSFKPSSFANSASQLSFRRSKFSGPKIPTTPNHPSQFLQQITIIFLLHFLTSLNLMIQNLLVCLLKHLIFHPFQ